MNPKLRVALHQCVDLICDAMNDEGQVTKPATRTRAPKFDASKVDAKTLERALATGRRLGML